MQNDMQLQPRQKRPLIVFLDEPPPPRKKLCPEKTKGTPCASKDTPGESQKKRHHTPPSDKTEPPQKKRPSSNRKTNKSHLCEEERPTPFDSRLNRSPSNGKTVKSHPCDSRQKRPRSIEKTSESKEKRPTPVDKTEPLQKRAPLGDSQLNRPLSNGKTTKIHPCLDPLQKRTPSFHSRLKANGKTTDEKPLCNGLKKDEVEPRKKKTPLRLCVQCKQYKLLMCSVRDYDDSYYNVCSKCFLNWIFPFRKPQPDSTKFGPEYVPSYVSHNKEAKCRYTATPKSLLPMLINPV